MTCVVWGPPLMYMRRIHIKRFDILWVIKKSSPGWVPQVDSFPTPGWMNILWCAFISYSFLYSETISVSHSFLILTHTQPYYSASPMSANVALHLMYPVSKYLYQQRFCLFDVLKKTGDTLILHFNSTVFISDVDSDYFQPLMMF